MGLAQLVETKTVNGKANKVRLMMQDMTESQLELFKTVIVDPVNFSAPAIAEACQADGFRVNQDQIRHFRRKLKEGSETL